MIGRVRSYSPQDPGDVLADLPATTADGVGQAVGTARAGAAHWRSAGAAARAHALADCAASLAAAADELADLVVREVGKPVGEATAEVARAVDICRYHAQAALLPNGHVIPSADGRALLHTRRSPYGVAGLVTPWNFPVAIPLWKLAPALAAGNGAVWKPAPEATAVALRVSELLCPHLPDGTLAVVPGYGEAGAAVVRMCDVVSFTGSSGVAAAVRTEAAQRSIPAQVEAGGINCSIVLEDADVDAASRAIAFAAMGFAGQKCTATQRIVVVGDAAAFAEALVAAVAALPLGDPADPTTVVGPLIDAAATTATNDAAERARAGGAAVHRIGTIPGTGHFAQPTIVSGDGPLLADVEVFGPICSVERAAALDDAVAAANATPFGLACAVFTNDLSLTLGLLDQLQMGLLKVNAPTTGVDLHAPFGGIKESGYGPTEQGPDALHHYSRTATIHVSPR